ncbi:MAG: PqqD family protein [Myxococcales bacterium]
MIAPTAIVRKNPRIAARVVDGKALVVVLDDKRLHTLNPVGTRVWELCEGRSVGEVARVLCEEFEVDEATALRDVQTFVAELRELGALQIEEAA